MLRDNDTSQVKRVYDPNASGIDEHLLMTMSGLDNCQ